MVTLFPFFKNINDLLEVEAFALRLREVAATYPVFAVDAGASFFKYLDDTQPVPFLRVTWDHPFDSVLMVTTAFFFSLSMILLLVLGFYLTFKIVAVTFVF